jgi:branched-chain amino acid transport system substrate-binding protein
MMKRSFRSFLMLLTLTAVLASTACVQPAETASPAPGSVVTIGFTTSLTGKYTRESADQTNGLILWIEQTNEAGGLRLANGEIVTLAYKTYDDQSDSAQTEAMYRKLVLEDKVDFLVGPYSSGLTNAATPVANLYRAILISPGAASDSSFQRNYTTVYQIYTPASRYLTPALDILSTLDPAAQRIAILHESDSFATTAALSIAPDLQAGGFSTVYAESYPTGTTDFGPFVQKIAAAQPDAILAGGHAADGVLLARELADQGVEAKLITLLISPAEPSFGDLGAAALGIMGPSQWEPDAAYSSISAFDAGLPWYGPTVPEFILSYQQAYGKDPTYFAAGGYAAGLVLQHAIENAGTLSPDLVLVALDSTNMATFFGRLQFDTSAKDHGLQIGHEMVYVQWQQDTSGAMVKRVVWPVNLATAPLLYPIPPATP